MDRIIKPWQENLIIYMLLLMAGNPTIMLYRSLVFTIYKVFFLAGVILLFLIYKDFKLRVNAKKLKMYLLFCGMVVLSVVLNTDTDGITTLFSYFVFIMLGMLISELMRPKRFYRTYMNVMLIICVTSLFLFAVQLCFPNILNRFLWTNTYVNENITYRSNIFFNVLTNTDPSAKDSIWMLSRNCGLFWEPGLFAAFILPAMVCLIEFRKTVHMFHLKLLIFLITLVSTESTMGIAALALVIVWYSIKNIKIFGAYIVLALVFLLTIGVSRLDYFLSVFRYKMQDSIFLPRIGLTALTIENVKKSLLWGQGFNGTLSNNGYFNIFFMFGLAFFLIWVSRLYKGCCKVAGKVLFCVVLMGLTSEPVAFTAIFWVYVFYGMETVRKAEMLNLKELCQ